MELKYITPPTNLGGGAISGVGTIHISEVKPTLDQLTIDLGWPVNFNELTTGSTGKRDYSGDIDLIISPHEYAGVPENLIDDLSLLFGKENVARNGAMVHLKYPIVDYNESKTERLPRTKFVQIDFCFGYKEWEQLFHFSSSESGYKGSHRNLALAAVAAVKDNDSTSELDDFGRPIGEGRWKWGPNGLFRVYRESKRNVKTGKYIRKQDDTIISGPHKDPVSIANILFRQGTAQDLDSLETVINAVKRSYPLSAQADIWKRIGKHFNEWKDGKSFHYPDEIQPFIESN